ncbi:MAG: DUF1080 domain-containing protein [Gemmataceae bacterium]
MRRTLLAPALAVALLGLSALRAEDKAEPFLDSDLSGWEGLVKEHWKYQDGVLTGTVEKGLKFNTFLCSKKKYKDFEMRFKVRLEGDRANSGVQVRSKVIDGKRYAVGGPQCDIGARLLGQPLRRGVRRHDEGRARRRCRRWSRRASSTTTRSASSARR